MIKKLSLLFLSILCILPLSISAQDATQEATSIFTDPLLLWSAGQIDPIDKNVYYSLFVASGDEVLDALTITANVHEDATFVEASWMPEGAVLVGEAEGVVTWQLPALGAETIAGPFTFRVTFANADAKDFAPQAAAEGAVTWGDQTLEAETFMEENLAVMEDTGDVTLEASGTMDLVPVGKTGAWIYVPADALSESVTLTVNRLAIAQDTVLPTVAEDTWWCGQYSVSADKAVSFKQPIVMLLPIRRALTPGMEVAVFTAAADGSWSALSDGVAETGDGESAYAIVSRDGVNVELTFGAASFDTNKMVFAVGVSAAKRKTATTGTTNVTDSAAPWF